ncbi:MULTISPECIES: carbohydrate ABC transporter permease [Streptomyces]|uniref:Carbohydrate ABC transporter permease n=2 Tax=Streptomyces TaxID=1883 RepID=A0ABV9J207_9ACTN
MTSVSPAPAHPGRRRRPSPRRIGLHAARIALALFFAFPIVFMLVSSFKPDEQIFGDLDGIKAFLPVGHLSLDNYTGVFDRVPAVRFLLNSVGISVITVVLSIFINSLAAFALSRMRWRGKKIVLTAVIATLIVPFETFALPMVWWVNKLPWLQLDGGRLVVTEGWLDTYQVQILPFVGNALFVFLFHLAFGRGARSFGAGVNARSCGAGQGWPDRRQGGPASSSGMPRVATDGRWRRDAEVLGPVAGGRQWVGWSLAWVMVIDVVRGWGTCGLRSRHGAVSVVSDG